MKIRRRSEQHGRKGAPSPTPIWISRRTRNVLLLAGLAALVLLMWAAPSVPLIALGGFALALIMSFPVRALARIMPRGLAILASFLALIGLIVIAVYILVPIIIEQLGSLIASIPEIAVGANSFLLSLLEPLDERGLLPGTPQEVLTNLGADLFERAQDLAQNILGGLIGFISSTLGFAITLFGVVFVAVYLLVDVRRLKAFYLLAMPHDYREDARDLWNAFAFSLSRYLAGLGFILVIQGALSAIALSVIGVRYAILLGAWVSITAIIPYIGAWLGAIPAILLALFSGAPGDQVSITTAVITAIVFLAIQQLEGNVLTPRIQGEALQVHPILVFFAVIAGGQIAGLLGVVFAVPALAVLRVLFDFFRVRLRTSEQRA